MIFRPMLQRYSVARSLPINRFTWTELRAQVSVGATGSVAQKLLAAAANASAVL